MKAVVTGGCKGLGLAFSLYLLNHGYEVFAIYHTSEEKAIKLEKEYKKLHTIKCDIKDETQVKNLFSNLKDIDILINNAAICFDNEFKDKTKEEFLRVLETNVVGTFLVTKYASYVMNDNSIILNISSNNAVGSNSPLSMDYDASKAGVNMLTKDFAMVLKSKVISICPGWIDTEEVGKMNPLFLKEELQRVKQNKLIDKDELVKFIFLHIKDFNSGDIIEISEVENGYRKVY